MSLGIGAIKTPRLFAVIAKNIAKRLAMNFSSLSLSSLCLFISLAQCPAWGKDQSTLKSMPKLDQQLRAALDHPSRPLASVSAIAIKSGKLVYQGHFGARVIEPQSGNPASPQSLPADAQTLYRIASISKMVATIGALRLLDQGKLDLDADISDYLGYRVRNPHFPDAKITTHMLVSHTSSLRDDNAYNFPISTSMQSFLTPDGANYGNGAQWAKPAPDHNAAPGQYFHYVNLNFGMLGAVMERVSGQRFDLYMRDTVLRPLGIAGGYNLEELSQEEVNHLAVLYRKQSNEIWNSAGPWVPQVDNLLGKIPAKRAGIDNYVLGSNATLFSPQGGLRISVEGLSKIMLMLMNHGQYQGVRILSADSTAALLRQEWRYDADKKNGDTDRGLMRAWALGAQIFTDSSAPHNGDRLVAQGGFKAVGHLGTAYGLQSGFFFDPISRNGMIYAIGGVSADPDQNVSAFSSLNSWETDVLDALYRHAIVGK